MFYLNYQISVTTMVLVTGCDVISTICLSIIIQLGGQKMPAGIVLSVVSVTKDPSWEVQNSIFFCCTMQFPNSQACQQHIGFSKVFSLN